MGIKEVNPLVKNLFQTGLKAFSSFLRGDESKSILCDFPACLPQAGFARVFNFLMVPRTYGARLPFSFASF